VPCYLSQAEPLISHRRFPSATLRSVAFEFALIDHCYVKLKGPRLLTQSELDSLRKYQSGDDWLAWSKSCALNHAND
jgi:hypothetical protein